MNTALLVPLSLCIGLGSAAIATDPNQMPPFQEVPFLAEVVQELEANQLIAHTEIAKAADPDKPDNSGSMIAANTSSAPSQPGCLFADSGCKRTQRLPRAGLRHIEGKGIGYGRGYTSLDLLLGPDRADRCFFPFLDLRGHIFDNGKLAANAGLGFRSLNGNRIWGANAYYDYRNSKGIHYNQVGAGLEFLGPTWDFRANGYLPVGRTHSSWSHLRFDRFEGNQFFVKRRQAFAMKGIDTEAGAHFNKTSNWDFYVGAGPYYFQGQGKNAWGGKARATTTYKDYLFLEMSGSYDTVFKNIGQIQVGLSLPFGPKAYAKRRNAPSNCCSTKALLEDRMIQPVVRQEIIVEDNRHRSDVAIDPSTGFPFFVLFVDNQSNSLGTFESPYPTFQQALTASNAGAIIYVLPGDATTAGLNAGTTAYQLKDSQQILGASAAHPIATTLGAIVIPPQASEMPHFAANIHVSVFDLADHNTLSGLHITADGIDQDLIGSILDLTPTYCIGTAYDPLSVNMVTDLTVTNCLLEAYNGSNGISPDGLEGFVNISGNTFSIDGFYDLTQGLLGMGVYIVTDSSTCFGTISDNTFSSRLYNDNASITGGANYPQADVYPFAGILIGAKNQSTVTLDILRNTLNNYETAVSISAGSGIYATAFSDSTGNLNITQNTITNTNGIGITADFSGASTISLNIEENSIVDVYSNSGISINAGGTSTSTISILSNYISGIAIQSAMDINSVGSAGTSNTTLLVEDNFLANCTDGIEITAGSNTNLIANVLSNRFTNFKPRASGGGSRNVGAFIGNHPLNSTSSSLCLTFNNNQSSTGEAYQFQSGTDATATFNLTPLINNIPQPHWNNISFPSDPGIKHVDTCTSSP